MHVHVTIGNRTLDLILRILPRCCAPQTSQPFCSQQCPKSIFIQEDMVWQLMRCEHSRSGCTLVWFTSKMCVCCQDSDQFRHCVHISDTAVTRDDCLRLFSCIRFLPDDIGSTNLANGTQQCRMCYVILSLNEMWPQLWPGCMRCATYYAILYNSQRQRSNYCIFVTLSTAITS
jgi:hypothetical protein